MFSVCAAPVLDWVFFFFNKQRNGHVLSALGPLAFGHLAVTFQLIFPCSLPGEAIYTMP